MKTLIEVTAEDIAKGIPKVCAACPVALAIKRVTGRGASVMQLYIGFHDGSGWIDSPREVLPFVRAFDNEQPVKPFSFELDVPEVNP